MSNVQETIIEEKTVPITKDGRLSALINPIKPPANMIKAYAKSVYVRLFILIPH